MHMCSYVYFFQISFINKKYGKDNFVEQIIFGVAQRG